MKYFATALLLMISILGARSADAQTFSVEGHALPIGLAGAITVPVEWAGIWSIQDSTYDCTGAFKSTTTSLDTLCAGHSFENDPTFVCTGSSTPTTFQQTCTGSVNVLPDCDAVFTMETHGTRSGESSFSVSTITVTYAGTGAGCSSFPPSCTQINSRSTRTAGPPAAYCASPARAATWGELKVLYR